MSTKAELEKQVEELKAQAARGIPPETLRLYSFIYATGKGPLVVSTPPAGAQELRQLQGALDTLLRLVGDRLLQAVAREAAEGAARVPPSVQ